MIKINRYNNKLISYLPVLITIGYLLTTYLIIYVFDIGNITQDRNWLLWGLVFSEAGPTERIQWGMLSAFAVLSAYTTGLLSRGNNKESTVWFWLSILGVILVIEDAGNTSHYVRNLFLLVDKPILSNFARFSVYFIYGIVAIIPLLLITKQKLSITSAYKTMFIGYVLYAAVSIASSSQEAIFNWYFPIGEWIIDNLWGGGLRFELPEGHWAYQRTGYYFMDTVFEESLELIAASVLTCSALIRIEHYHINIDSYKYYDASMQARTLD